MSKPSKNIQWQKLFIQIRSSLWFFPALTIIAAILLALGLVEVDIQFDPQLHKLWPRIFGSEAEGARAMLLAIASSMVTVAGVVFSITIVALALTSTQYSSRVLRTFMRDRATQLVLGVFIGTYIYCLIVLRTFSNGNGGFVPSLAVFGGLVLAIAAACVFIFFIHHISAAIQAAQIVAQISRETLQTIDDVFQHALDSDDDQKVDPDSLSRLDWHPIASETMGYAQSVDIDQLSALAHRYGAIIRMECQIGDFVATGLPLVSIANAGAADDKLARLINKSFAIGTYRIIEQDPAFGIRQLVDISLKALSPGINDTTTAVTCIEHLSVILSRCAQRRMDTSFVFMEGALRVIGKPPSFEQLVSLSFLQILENAEGNTEVFCRLLAAISQICQFTANRQRAAILNDWVDVIEVVAGRSTKSGPGLKKVAQHLYAARAAISRRQ